jgi:hypothetical protein
MINCKIAKNRSGDVVEVQRTLRDFVFVQSQVRFEYPETFLPTLSNLKECIAYGSRPSPITQILNIENMNLFLHTMTHHPLLRYHELVGEFLYLQHLDVSSLLCSTWP